MKPPTIPAWDAGFSHWTPFVTLPQWGYQTNVATMNNGHEATIVRLSAWTFEGRNLARGWIPKRLEPGERLIVRDVDHYFPLHQIVAILHQCPVSWNEPARERPTAEISGWMGMGDDWVEYRKPDGAGGGVLYTGFFFNDPRTATRHSTVVQSPKVLLGPRYETGLILMNVSTWAAHASPAEVSVRLHHPSGVHRTVTTIPAWGADVLTMSHHGEQEEDYGLLIAISPTVTVVPIGFIRDLRSGALAIDHTMPPGSYHDAWGDTEKRATWAAAIA